ncbi:MAG: hypothetical protein DI551_08810 [Micavibrio aeruginosavorus]|uniref:Uncharacterized protein n=1 Tax=Micavibrio aeruginosavorus TaxID=349221 RepID=A0A2W5MW10_9BACT|nr:MAG: hypothetical protein DI551_08810 [Micavibrio aeruginosavorus]
MPVKDLNGPKTPEEIYEELRLKADMRIQNEDERNELYEEIAADNKGHEDERGGRRRRYRKRMHHCETDHDKNKLADIFGGFDGTKSLLTGIVALSNYLQENTEKNEKTKALAGTFSKRADDKSLPRCEDTLYVYDSMDVSEPAYNALMQESEIITKKLEELVATRDPARYAVLEKDLLRLADEYEMRLHPLTGLYVHDWHRVEREEAKYNPHNHLQQRHNVYIYVLKAELNDVRGIKRHVGDQFDQKPEEVIASGPSAHPA